jgi:hypothetical protein
LKAQESSVLACYLDAWPRVAPLMHPRTTFRRVDISAADPVISVFNGWVGRRPAGMRPA